MLKRVAKSGWHWTWLNGRRKSVQVQTIQNSSEKTQIQGKDGAMKMWAHYRKYVVRAAGHMLLRIQAGFRRVLIPGIFNLQVIPESISDLTRHVRIITKGRLVKTLLQPFVIL